MSISTIIALCLSGILLISCEIIVPGGIVGTIGFILAIAGVVGAFGFGVVPGLITLMSVTVLGLLVSMIMLRILPKTRHGKTLCLGENQEGFSAAGEKSSIETGQTGVSMTKLRPAGVAELNGKRVDVVTQGEFIEPNSKIKVIEVHGSRVVVVEFSE